MVYNIEEQWKPVVSFVGKILLTKVLELEKPDKIFIAFSKLCCLLQEKTRFIENQKLH